MAASEEEAVERRLPCTIRKKIEAMLLAQPLDKNLGAESRTLVVSILLGELRRLDLRKTLVNSNFISQNAYSDVNRVNLKSPKSNVFV